MNRLLSFVQYHNAVPIAISLMLLGAGGVLAATNPEAVYSSKQTPISVDNTYIANKDLSSYSPRMEITSVTEDETYYYVGLNFYTIDVDDSVWKDVIKRQEMKIAKTNLGSHQDLGLYVTEQLKDIIYHENARLRESQASEGKHVSQKTIATTYGGLVGKFLDDTTETLPGYVPVVVPPTEEASPFASEPPAGAIAGASAAASTKEPASSPPPQNAGVLQILGNNPARIELKSAYSDLGAAITDPRYANLGIHTFLNGIEVNEITIDTSKEGTWTIRYDVVGEAGVVASAERLVIVFDPNPKPALSLAETSQSATTSSSASPSPSTTTASTTTAL